MLHNLNSTRHTRGSGASMLLLLAISLGSAAQLAPSVQPAPQRGITNARFYFTVKAPSKLCIGESKVVTVTPLFDMSGTFDDGQAFNLTEHIFTGVSVAAEILDTGVATVSPASAKSGALTRSLFETRSLADFGLSANLGALEFSVKGVKAGSTALILTAQAPVPAGSNQTKYFGPSGMPPSIAIKVVSCKYKLTINQAGIWYDSGISGFHSGAMTMTISGKEGDQLTGSGTFGAGWYERVPGCGSSHTITSVPVKATATLSDTTLAFTVNWVGKVTGSGSVSCPFGSGSGGGTRDASFIYPSRSGNLPAEGGAAIYNFDCYGGKGKCTLSIMAEPLDQ